MRTSVALAIGGLVTTTAFISAPRAADASTLGPVTYTSSRNVTVPTTACHAKFVVVGSSGDAGKSVTPGPSAGAGGLGAKVTATMSVLPGSQLRVDLESQGGTGGAGLGFDGGNGGGYTAIRSGSGETPVIVAGGGGGGGASGPGGNGGAGGAAGAKGGDGFQLTTGKGQGDNASGGQPGTQHAGGAAGTDTAAPDGAAGDDDPAPTAGSFLAGGRGGSNGDGGGGGGGGYYGGGGGAGGYDASGAGGGGGSNLVPAGGTATTATTAGPGSVTVTWIQNCGHERPTLKLSSPFRGFFLAKVHTHPTLRHVLVTIVTVRHGHATVMGDVRTNSHGAGLAMFPAKPGSKVKVQVLTPPAANASPGKSAIKSVRIHR